MEKGDFRIVDAKKLSKVSISEMKRIFQDDQGQNPMPCLRERQKNWRDLGHKLVEYWDGEFLNLVKEIDNSLLDFVRYSREFRAFDDALCKLVMVNAILHKGRGLVDFIESVFPGIDYQLLKQLLRIGVIIPRGKMKDKLYQKEILNSNEARELRNAGLFSFLQIIERTSIPGDVVDNILWLNRKTCVDANPMCNECKFMNVCKKRVKYLIPLEITRYY